MFVLEAKLRGSTRQFAIIDEMIHTAGFVRNSCIRQWMDNRGVGQYDLSALCSVAYSSPMNPENTTGVTAASSSLASTEAPQSPNPELTIQQIQQPWVQSQAVLGQPSASEPLMPKVPQPELASLPESRSLLPPRPVIQPQITALPEQPTSPPSTKPTSPPTIQVTIGRIDVRAIAAPTPSRRPSTPSPAKLSLDEYLRSRSSGASRKGGRS